jgi:hypothetical protein
MNLLALLVDVLPFALGLLVGWCARQWRKEGSVQIGSWRYPPLTGDSPPSEAPSSAAGVPDGPAGPAGRGAGGAAPPPPADDATWISAVDAVSTGQAGETAGAPGLRSGAPEPSESERRLYGELVVEMRTVSANLAQQTNQLGALRTDFKQRLESIEGAVREMERQAADAAREAERRMSTDPVVKRVDDGDALPRRTDAGGEDGRWADAGTNWISGVETHSVSMLEPGRALDSFAASSGVPVEVREGMLVLSHSLPPMAYAVPEGKNRARVFLNESVEINEFALPKWQAFFDLVRARPYATYRTVRAAEVSWDGERGAPLNPGVAEPV